MQCWRCGNVIPDNSAMCSRCGAHQAAGGPAGSAGPGGYQAPPPGYGMQAPPPYGGAMPPPRQGMGAGAIIGIGCGVFLLLGILALVGLYYIGARQSRESVRPADNVATSGMAPSDNAAASTATAPPDKGEAAANATAQPDALDQGDETTGKSETESGSRSEGRQ